MASRCFCWLWPGMSMSYHKNIVHQLKIWEIWQCQHLIENLVQKGHKHTRCLDNGRLWPLLTCEQLQLMNLSNSYPCQIVRHKECLIRISRQWCTRVCWKLSVLWIVEFFGEMWDSQGPAESPGKSWRWEKKKPVLFPHHLLHSGIMGKISKLLTGELTIYRVIHYPKIYTVDFLYNEFSFLCAISNARWS